MRRIRAHVRRAAGDGGYTLPELLTTMAILLIVLTGITALFVSGSKAQTDLTARFDAQTELRVGLDKLRRQIHSACSATGVTADVPTSSVTLSLPGSTAGTCTTTVTWCTQGSGSHYGLYQVDGSTCSGGTRYADFLTSPTIFTYLEPDHYVDPSTGQYTVGSYSLARLHVDMTVDANPNLTGGAYHVVDDIVFRNSQRS